MQEALVYPKQKLHTIRGFLIEEVVLDLGLAGKSVLITGASRGIGHASALTFAAEGCSLHLAARSTDEIEALRKEILAKHKVKVDLHPGDLSTTASMVKLARACGDIDVLLNNAGDIPAGTVEALEDADWRRGFDLKVFGYINLTREIYTRMKKRGSGVIINNIGNSGENWDYNYVAGSTGNAALMSFTKAVGGISLDYGVRVVGVNPGPIATDRMVRIMKRRARDNLGDEARWQEYLSDYPGGRMGTAQEVRRSHRVPGFAARGLHHRHDRHHRRRHRRPTAPSSRRGRKRNERLRGAQRPG